MSAAIVTALPDVAHSGHVVLVLAAAVIVSSGGLILLGLAVRRTTELGRTAAAQVEHPLVERSLPRARSAVSKSLVLFAAALSMGTAIIHLAVGLGSVAGLDSLAGLFAAAGVFEALWAVAVLVRPGRAVAITGIVVNMGIVALWLAGRAIGLPSAGLAGSATAAQLVVATAFGVLLVATLAWLEYGLPRASEARVRQLGTLVSIGAVPVLSLLVLVTIIVMGGAGGTTLQG